MLNNEETMITDNINLIYHVLKKYKLYNNRDEFYDLGVIGLIKGVRSFDPKKNIKLSTYLAKCISSEILHHIREMNAIKRGRGKKIISIYTPIKSTAYSTDEEIQLIDVIPSEVNVIEDFENVEQIKMLQSAIEKLGEEERFIVCSSFGAFGYSKLSQEELADTLNCSQSCISRRLKKALDDIKNDIKD